MGHAAGRIARAGKPIGCRERQALLLFFASILFFKRCEPRIDFGQGIRRPRIDHLEVFVDLAFQAGQFAGLLQVQAHGMLLLDETKPTVVLGCPRVHLRGPKLAG